jgi:hypothetical protein
MPAHQAEDDGELAPGREGVAFTLDEIPALRAAIDEAERRLKGAA